MAPRTSAATSAASSGPEPATNEALPPSAERPSTDAPTVPAGDAPTVPVGDAPDTDDDQLARWFGVAKSFVAPATLLAALLFYFGYVYSRAQYAYFGIDVDTIGLSTNDFVMRSPQALLVPLLLIALGGAAVLLSHLAVSRRQLSRRTLRAAGGVAVGLTTAGGVLLFGFPWFGDGRFYSLVTPLLLAAGLSLGAYLTRFGWVVDSDLLTSDLPADGGPVPGRGGAGATGVERRQRRTARRGALVLTLVAVATCLFWATATVAEWAGRGQAKQTADDLGELPMVILDTQERLYLTDPVVEEKALPSDAEQTFRYRYRNLRLLVHGEDRLFLVPTTWTPSNSTLVVPLDGSVRVQFRFVNDPPPSARTPAPAADATAD
jgi:hypothetical protein